MFVFLSCMFVFYFVYSVFLCIISPFVYSSLFNIVVKFLRFVDRAS